MSNVDNLATPPPVGTQTAPPGVSDSTSFPVPYNQSNELASVGQLIAAALIDALIAAVTLSIGWLIWAAITAGSAQTPGKKMLNLQVVDASSYHPMSWGNYVFLRGLIGGTVLSLAASLTFGIMTFMPLWDRRNQSVAAKVSNSVVVITK